MNAKEKSEKAITDAMADLDKSSTKSIIDVIATGVGVLLHNAQAILNELGAELPPDFTSRVEALEESRRLAAGAENLLKKQVGHRMLQDKLQALCTQVTSAFPCGGEGVEEKDAPKEADASLPEGLGGFEALMEMFGLKESGEAKDPDSNADADKKNDTGCGRWN